MPAVRALRESCRAPSVVSRVTGKPAEAMEAATVATASTAMSKSRSAVASCRATSSSGYDAARVSSTSVLTGKLESTSWRTISVPVRAVVRQCTCRRSSPMTYSRSAWNVTVPLGAVSEVGPSMLAVRPEASAGSAAVRGRTSSVAGSP